MSHADRAKPYDEAAEIGVLGSFLLDPVNVATLCQRKKIGPDHFYQARHSQIYKAMQVLVNEGTLVDVLTTESQLSKSNLLEQVGGRHYLTEVLLEQTPTAIHAEHYVQNLHEAYVRRVCMEHLERIATACHNGIDIEELVTSVNSATVKIMEANAHGTTSSRFGDLAVHAVQQWKDIKDGKEAIAIASKYKQLNTIMMGYRKELNCIGALRAVGKTTHLGDEALAMGMRGIPSLIVSLETPAVQISQRILGNLSNFSTFRFDMAGGDSNEWRDLMENMDKKVPDLPIHIVNCDNNINSILQQIEYHIAKYRIEAVFIDYLQLIQWHTKTSNRNEMVGNVTGKLATHCLGRYASIVYSQFNRGPEYDQRDPVISDLRDSGSIEQDARKILLIYRDRTDDNEVYVFELAKNNSGPIGRVRAVRISNRQRWEELRG